MKYFPDEARFIYTWRPYQARALSELWQHLEDNRFHLVAAPGSGKTVVGIEVVLRQNCPALIISPTLTIRNQWIRRLVELFLPKGYGQPTWVSTDIRRPALFTVTTYQALHSAYTGFIEDELEETGEEEETFRWTDEEISHKRKKKRPVENVVDILKRAGIRTVILDEAHHLRHEWWKVLVATLEQLDDPAIVSLTATPPLDVPRQEWDRYTELCGPIDSEISVPELVKEGHLCPHQDCVHFSVPSQEEAKQIEAYRKGVEQIVGEICRDPHLIEALEQHPWVLNPESHVQEILSQPAYMSSIAIFLSHAGRKPPKSLIKLLGVSKKQIPPLDLEWMEILLNGSLYKESATYFEATYPLVEYERRLRRIGAIERRQVFLRSTKAIRKLLASSISKLGGIAEIIEWERKSLGDELRLVVLTDFIRKEELPKGPDDLKPLYRIGVVPIFEKIRREGHEGLKLGALSGTLVIMPKSAIGTLQRISEEMKIGKDKLIFRTLKHDPNYASLRVKGARQSGIVSLITRAFHEGEFNVLVGTKSLLGEGWDAPSINALILASFVGSYMLSNQMRGRAIRIQKGNPKKTANIWHLVCVETGYEGAGPDFEMLTRRFKAFVGVSFREPVIENGVGRLDLRGPPFRKGHVEFVNGAMTARARDRAGLRQLWTTALAGGTQIVQEIRVPIPSLPRDFVFKNTIKALLLEGLLVGGYFFMRWVEQILEASDFWFGKWPALGAALVFVGAAIFVLPKTLKALWLFIRHGPVASSLKQVGKAVLATLRHIDIIQTSKWRVGVSTEKGEWGEVSCSLKGATIYEKSIFLDAVGEVLDPIKNPRYLIERRSRWAGILRKDYHAVPKLIGRKKPHAEHFAKMWKKRVGASKLIFTRTGKGREMLLHAREHSMSRAFQRRSERISSWK